MTRQTISIRTSDGEAKATLVSAERPQNGKAQAGVILYMDAFGPRPALDDMAARLATAGYVVVVPDLFYRLAPYGPFEARTAFADPDKRAALMSLIQKTTQEMTRRDAPAFIDALTKAGANGKIGTVGYCMGGGRAIAAAAAVPERVAAAASIHGGNLASDSPDSPHRSAAAIKGRVYVGSAGVDGSFPPEQSARLAEALRQAEIDHIIENYVGMQHGWAVSDHSVYDAAGAERHWTRLLTFFAESLA